MGQRDRSVDLSRALAKPEPRERVADAQADGVVVDLDSYIGGRWRARPDVTDLGDVPAREAAEYLLGRAEVLD